VLEAEFFSVQEQTEGRDVPDGMVILSIQFLGDRSDADTQREVIDRVHSSLSGVPFEPHGHGVVISGGSVNHRWAFVTIDGEPTDTKVPVGPDDDPREILSKFAPLLGVEVERLGITDPPESQPPNS
jgi:hypothetical protein